MLHYVNMLGGWPNLGEWVRWVSLDRFLCDVHLSPFLLPFLYYLPTTLFLHSFPHSRQHVSLPISFNHLFLFISMFIGTPLLIFLKSFVISWLLLPHAIPTIPLFRSLFSLSQSWVKETRMIEEGVKVRESLRRWRTWKRERWDYVYMNDLLLGFYEVKSLPCVYD